MCAHDNNSSKTSNHTDLDTILISESFHQNPYPVYRRLRNEAPVTWCDPWNSWILSRYDDVVNVLKDFKNFSNEGRQEALLAQLPKEELEKFQTLRNHYASGGLINSDPPDHTRLRKLVNKAFTPRIVKRMEPLVREVADDLLSKTRDCETFDLIESYAFPIPAIVIAGLLGVPPQDRHLFKTWTETANLFPQSTTVTREIVLNAQEALVNLREYMSGLLKEREKNPQEDLLTTLSSVREDDDFLSREELLSTACTLLIAGHETTTNLIGNGVLALLCNPKVKEEVILNPGLMPIAIEEFLRYDAPVQSVKRVTIRDTEVNGQTIRKGELVQILIGSANRDETAFGNPDQLNIHRENKRHVAFGAGIHTCLGAALARMEGPVAFRALFNQIRNLKLAVPPEELAWSSGNALRGLQSLPVKR